MAQRILVVEDEFILSQGIQRILIDLGFEIADAAFDGYEAIEKAKNCHPDLILMDIELNSQLDGIETAEIITRLIDIPVIYLTAYSDEKTLSRAKLTRPFGYINKPFNENDLRTAIEVAIYGHHIESELKKLNKRLKDEIAAKDKFFSIIAHDLKSTFMTLYSGAQILLNINEYDAETITQVSKELYLSIDNQYKLLENLLTWARFQMGKIEYINEELDLFLNIGATIDLLKEQAKKKRIAINNKVKENTFVIGDCNVLNTVLRNLISNAIKFTGRGGMIEISTNAKNDDVEITIKDNGQGIERDKLALLFNVDSRYHQKGTEGEKGTGLGLIVCKEFIEKSGGKIWVESEKGVGSKFTFTMPKNVKTK